MAEPQALFRELVGSVTAATRATQLAARQLRDANYLSHAELRYSQRSEATADVVAKCEADMKQLLVALNADVFTPACLEDPRSLHSAVQQLCSEMADSLDSLLDQHCIDERSEKTSKQEQRKLEPVRKQPSSGATVDTGAGESVAAAAAAAEPWEPMDWTVGATGAGGPGDELRSRLASVLGERPQDTFKTPPDNSNAPFSPDLTHLQTCIQRQPRKAAGNALQKLEKIEAHAAQLNPAATHEAQYSHPFADALDMLPERYLQWQLQDPQAAPPPDLDEPASYVDTQAGLDDMLQHLAGATEVAVDLEHSDRSFQGFTCLMQISTRQRDFIVDALALRSQLGPSLASLFADSGVVKVMHGAESDVMWLQKDFGIFVVNLFDTGQAARVLGMACGLAALMMELCERHTDKQYQRADWRQRPLPPGMLHYARLDTHFLLHIADLLRKRLLHMTDDMPAALVLPLPRRGPQGPLGVCLERSRQLCLKLYERPRFSDNDYLACYASCLVKLSPQQLSVFAALYAWRDATARAVDDNRHAVLSRQQLVLLARAMPTTAAAVCRLLTRFAAIATACAEEVAGVVKVAQERELAEFERAAADISMVVPAPDSEMASEAADEETPADGTQGGEDGPDSLSAGAAVGDAAAGAAGAAGVDPMAALEAALEHTGVDAQHQVQEQDGEEGVEQERVVQGSREAGAEGGLGDDPAKASAVPSSPEGQSAAAGAHAHADADAPESRRQVQGARTSATRHAADSDDQVQTAFEAFDFGAFSPKILQLGGGEKRTSSSTVARGSSGAPRSSAAASIGTGMKAGGPGGLKLAGKAAQGGGALFGAGRRNQAASLFARPAQQPPRARDAAPASAAHVALSGPEAEIDASRRSAVVQGASGNALQADCSRVGAAGVGKEGGSAAGRADTAGDQDERQRVQLARDIESGFRMPFAVLATHASRPAVHAGAAAEGSAADAGAAAPQAGGHSQGGGNGEDEGGDEAAGARDAVRRAMDQLDGDTGGDQEAAGAGAGEQVTGDPDSGLLDHVDESQFQSLRARYRKSGKAAGSMVSESLLGDVTSVRLRGTSCGPRGGRGRGRGDGQRGSAGARTGAQAGDGSGVVPFDYEAWLDGGEESPKGGRFGRILDGTVPLDFGGKDIRGRGRGRGGQRSGGGRGKPKGRDRAPGKNKAVGNVFLPQEPDFKGAARPATRPTSGSKHTTF